MTIQEYYTIIPNPWHFSNEDKNLVSPGGQIKLEVGFQSEIAMGGPLCCEYYIVFADKKIKLKDWFGGPIKWNEKGNKIALPVWKMRQQKMAVIDIDSMTITIFKKEFRVLHIQNFKGDIITGIDSPIYMISTFEFDVCTESVESVKEIR